MYFSFQPKRSADRLRRDKRYLRRLEAEFRENKRDVLGRQAPRTANPVLLRHS